MRTTLIFAAVVAASSMPVRMHAQCPGGSPGGGATGAILRLVTLWEDTGSVNSTNRISLSQGQRIDLSVASPQSPPNIPLGIYTTPGGPGSGLALPGTPDLLYLNLAQGLAAIVDGLGIVAQPPDPNATLPGPYQPFAMGLSIPFDASLTNTCFTLQAALLDFTAPIGLRISNAVAVGIKVGITNVTPNFGPPGSTVTLAHTHPAGGGTAVFGVFDPARTAGSLTVNAAALGPPSCSFTVPADADSGPTGYSTTPSLAPFPPPPFVSDRNPDDSKHHFVVTDPAGILVIPPPPAAWPIPLHVSPSNPAERRYSGVGSLGTLREGSLNLNAGDILRVELYSLNVARTRVLDGFGSTFLPGAAEGFNPAIELFENNFVLPLTFGFGTSLPPFLIHGDDDSGPGLNARLEFQARVSSSLTIRLASVSPSAFVTGDYLVNIRVLSGAPSVRGFTIAGVADANVAESGEVVLVHGSGFTPGTPMTAQLISSIAYWPQVATAVATALSTTTATFTVPPFGGCNPQFSFHIGARHVRLVAADDSKSFLWSTAYATMLNGPLPEILVIRAAPMVITTPIAAAGPLFSSTSIRQLVPLGDMAGIAIIDLSTCSSRLGVEVLGIDPTSSGRRVKSLVSLGGPFPPPIYDPDVTIAQVSAPTFTLSQPPVVIAHNGDNGLFPTPSPYGWTSGAAAGIGRGAAVVTGPLTPLPFATGNSAYVTWYQDPIHFGLGPYEILINITFL